MMSLVKNSATKMFINKQNNTILIAPIPCHNYSLKTKARLQYEMLSLLGIEQFELHRLYLMFTVLSNIRFNIIKFASILHDVKKLNVCTEWCASFVRTVHSPMRKKEHHNGALFRYLIQLLLTTASCRTRHLSRNKYLRV